MGTEAGDCRINKSAQELGNLKILLGVKQKEMFKRIIA